MSSCRLTGHKISSPLVGERRVADRLDRDSMGASPRHAIWLGDRCPPVRLQLRPNCVEQAVSAMLVANAVAEGISLPEPSVDFLYAVAQIFARPLMPLENEGTSLRALFQGLHERGMVTEAEYPETDSPIEMPPDHLWRKAEDGVVFEHETLSDGSTSADEIYAELSAGRTSTVCWVVDEAYAAVGDGIHRSSGGAAIGGHCQLVVGCEVTSDGELVMLVRNSWGLDFGYRGIARVAASFINRSTYEKFVCRRGPKGITL